MQRVNIFTPIISTGFLGQFFGSEGRLPTYFYCCFYRIPGLALFPSSI